jgi:WS/DGAT/MGAT family acyltransferase
MPRPAPSGIGLLRDEIARRVSLPGRLARNAAQALRRPRRSFDAAAHAASGLANSVASSLSPASETPFNVAIGPHRRFDWTHFDLDAVAEIKAKLGGTVNDVALACVAGAVREHLVAHGTSLEGIDFRAMIPISTRTHSERGKPANRVSLLMANLPVDDADPARRLYRVIEETSRLKDSGQAEGTAIFENVSDWTVTELLIGFSRLAASRRAYNLVVTNVPGPGVPVYLAGARMLASYPLVPLFANQGLGIALLSYDGRLHWGFNSDWDAIPDLHELVLAVESEFETLRRL